MSSGNLDQRYDGLRCGGSSSSFTTFLYSYSGYPGMRTHRISVGSMPSSGLIQIHFRSVKSKLELCVVFGVVGVDVYNSDFWNSQNGPNCYLYDTVH